MISIEQKTLLLTLIASRLPLDLSTIAAFQSFLDSDPSLKIDTRPL
jgi:hypothetical protein